MNKHENIIIMILKMLKLLTMCLLERTLQQQLKAFSEIQLEYLQVNYEIQ